MNKRAINVSVMPRSQRHDQAEVEAIEDLLEGWLSERDGQSTAAIKHELFLKLSQR